MKLNNDQFLSQFSDWYRSLQVYPQNKGPAVGTIAASLVVLDQLTDEYDLNIESHLAPKKTQIKGASGMAVAKLLAKFGETRPFAKEGGRTNRGVMSEIQKLLDCLRTLNLENFTIEERNKILNDFQKFLVDRVKDYHNRQKVKLVFDPAKSTWQNLQNLLDAAEKENKAGPVAQHLVGAKLQLRYPEIPISNESTFTADKPTKRRGDFIVRDTVFHVTVSPAISVYQKCKENLDDGLKVYLLVRDSRLASARENAYEFAQGQIAVQSIESFVSQNIDEISSFDRKTLVIRFSDLISLYNKRVDASETDKSLMIELPSNLIKGDG
jgi:hypothetical protein